MNVLILNAVPVIAMAIVVFGWIRLGDYIDRRAQGFIRAAILGMDITIPDDYPRRSNPPHYKRFLGAEIEIVCERWSFITRLNSLTRSCSLDALCQTRSGTWTMVGASMDFGFRPKLTLVVSEFNESSARDWIFRENPEEYERRFDDRPAVTLA